MNADHSDGVGPTVACACGRAARYAGRRPKTFLSVVGPLTLERAYYYHCDACHAGICPRDRALGLEGTSLSPATMRMVGLAAAEVSFAKTGELLGELAGVHVESKQVERAAEALGREVAADERDVVEPVPGAPRRRCTWGWTAPACRCAQPRSKDAAASSPTVRPRPARSSWSPRGRPKHATRRAGPSATPGSVSYNAAVESAASRDTDPLPFVGRLELGYSYRQLALIERLSSAEAARKALGRALRRLIGCMSNA